MTKVLSCFILFLSFFLAAAVNTQASENFTVDTNVEYKVQPTGITSVTNTITIRNRETETFAQSYILSLSSLEPQNIKAYQSGIQLKPVVDKKDNTVNIKVDFTETPAGKDNFQTFIITYDEASIATKTGDVWEISVPKISNSSSFREYNTTLSVPISFGDLAYVSPKPYSVTSDGHRVDYRYQKKDVEDSGVMIGFGKFQSYLLELKYHLENTTSSKNIFQIALPPDTSLQRLYYKKIDPVPENVTLDTDGNWLAEYTLQPGKKVDVSAEMYAQIFAEPLKYLQPSPTNLLANLKKSQYWQTDNAEIVNLANNLKTPEKIYNFVTSTLTYDYTRVRPDAVRLGAIAALKNPTTAICMEFTDLFVTLARAAGIPSREVNGYAVSANPRLEPLSLVADVLHSWPEYWHPELKNWVAIDPTWGNTSGVDYFSKLNLKHIAFVIHGSDSVTPHPAGSYKLGSNPQKDIHVAIAKLPEERFPDLEIQINQINSLPFFSKKFQVTIKNLGSAAYYDLTTELYYDSKKVDSSYLPVLPPYGIFTKEVALNNGLFGLNSPQKFTVKAGDISKEVPINQTQGIIYQLTLVCLILIVLLLIFHFKTSQTRIIPRLKKLITKIYSVTHGFIKEKTGFLKK